VIDDKIYLTKRINLLWITAHVLHGRPHSGQINDSWHSSEILENNPGRFEGDFYLLWRGLLPIKNRLNIGLLDIEFVAITNCTFEEYSDREWELCQPRVVEPLEVVVAVCFRSNIKLFAEPVEWVR